MSFHEKIDTNDATKVDHVDVAVGRRDLKDDPFYAIWFGLSEDRLWALGGKLSAAFIAVVSIGVLGAIVVAAAS